MAERKIAFRFPASASIERAELVTDYGLRGGRLLVSGFAAVNVPSREALFAGVRGNLPGTERAFSLRAYDDDDVRLSLDGVDALLESALRAPSSRSAFLHGALGLGASFFGFVASYLYVLRARAFDDAWAMKMALHMAAWHLLLAVSLFPASAWGQRIGIRAVQVASLVFFFIHVSIAGSNLEGSAHNEGPWIAIFNAMSGLMFLATVVYGQRAHADMDPLRAARPPAAR